MSNIFIKNEMLLGKESYSKLANKCVAVIGLGGVGGTFFECLLRSGVSSFLLIDKDIVSESNLNRQILYVEKDISKEKVEVAKEKALSINSEVSISTLLLDVNEETIKELDKYKLDFVVDAIDSVAGKLAITKYCLSHNIPFISSLGMANRLDPTKVEITTLNKTEYDPLAKKLRSVYRKNEIPLSKINVVLSKEEPVVRNKELSSMMMVPSSAGLTIAYFAINVLSK